MAEAFLGSRLRGDTAGRTLGVLPGGTGAHALIDQITPGRARAQGADTPGISA